MDQESNLKKYEELYRLSKEGLEEELNRFKRLDEKAARYFTVLGLLLAATSFTGRATIDLITKLSSLWDYSCLISGILIIVGLMFSLYHVWIVLKIELLTKMPASAEMIAFFDEHDYIDIIDALTRGLIDAIAENRQVNDRKVRHLTRAHRAVIATLALISIFTFSILAQTWSDKSSNPRPVPSQGVMTMPQDSSIKPTTETAGGDNTKPQNGSSNTGQGDRKPDRNIKPPAFDQVNEGYDPSVGMKKGQQSNKPK